MRFTRGFTFVEVMLVIAFIGIMTGVTFVSMSGRRDDAALKGAAREVAAALRTAQNNALSGTKEPGNNNGICFQGMSWENETTYEIYVAHLRNGNTRLCSNSADIVEHPYVLATYTLKNGVTFALDAGNVFFDVPRGAVRPLSVLSIELLKGEKSFFVCVASSGIITEKKEGC